MIHIIVKDRQIQKMVTCGALSKFSSLTIYSDCLLKCVTPVFLWMFMKQYVASKGFLETLDFVF